MINSLDKWNKRMMNELQFISKHCQIEAPEESVKLSTETMDNLDELQAFSHESVDTVINGLIDFFWNTRSDLKNKILHRRKNNQSLWSDNSEYSSRNLHLNFAREQDGLS